MPEKHVKIPRICSVCNVAFNGCEYVCLKLEAAENAEKAAKREALLNAYTKDSVIRAAKRNKSHKRH